MLNKNSFLTQLNTVTGALFTDYTAQYDLAARTWQALIRDEDFQRALPRQDSPWILPTWIEPIEAVTPGTALTEPYAIVGTDGSQIYPDRHMGTLCSLVNTGIVAIEYKEKNSTIHLEAIPRVELINEQDLFSGVEYINARRQELELSYALSTALSMKERGASPVYLCDGSLILWHLETAHEEIREEFLARYLSIMHRMYHEGIPMIGYISLPKSKELVNLVRMYCADGSPSKIQADDPVDHVLDTHVAGSFLSPGDRTPLFASHASIIEHYAPHIKPHFFYLHVGSEVVRVEIPQWVAQDSALVDHVVGVLLDQVAKGGGYPVVIAESHEQAVIKGPDRDFFYQSIYAVAERQRMHIALSHKQRKKIRINV